MPCSKHDTALLNPAVDIVSMGDDEYILYGAGEDAGEGWNTYQTQDAFCTFVSGSNTWIFGTKANIYSPGARDLGLAASTDPLFVITSSTSWVTAQNQYLAFSYNAAGSYGSIDVGTGTIRMQDEVVCTTHLYLGDNDRICRGDGNDAWDYFDATSWQFGFASLGAAAANGGHFIVTCQNAGSTGDRTGGSFYMTAGAKANAGLDGGAIFKAGYFDLFNQAGTANTFIRLDAGTTTAATGTIATGTALTSGLELVSAAGGIVADSAAGITLEATTTFRADGTTHSFYPAAGTANQYFQIDVDTTDTLCSLISGSAITAGIKVAPTAGDINLDSVAKLILDGGLHVNRTAVTGATAATGRTTAVLGVSYAGTVTITLSTLDCTANRIITVKDEGGYATAYPITIATEGAELIDGSATALIDTAYTSLTLYSNGSNWFVM